MTTTAPRRAAARPWTLYDRLSSHYALLASLSERAAGLQGLTLLRPREGETVLEVGCGPGFALADLAHAAGTSGRVRGLDLSPRMVALARRRLAQANSGPTSRVDQGDIRSMPFPSTSFDACFVSFTLELLSAPDMVRALAECKRVLRPDGRLVVVSLSKNGPETRARSLYESGHRLLPSLLDCRPIRVAQSLATAGFRVAGQRVFRLWGLPVEVVRGEVR
jgi:ubiquinone/menaquinone biosynthesis C-methylase UbiE